jgi:hypothetical protein
VVVKVCIAVERKVTVDRRVIEPGALYWDDDVPLVALPGGVGEGTRRTVGWLREIHRHNGAIFATLDFPAMASYAPSGLAPEVDPAELEIDSADGLLRVVSGRLRAVVLVAPDRATWSECVL